ncbi:MAG: hypothetical protein IKP73_04855 [Bacteroidales bacterium]|nr:hypothetical protein [Bacteroidales bacterium]
MNLNQAIQKIINDNGVDILKSSPFMGLLGFYKAFEQQPYAANMLNQMYSNGYGTKIYKLYCNQDETEVADFILEMRKKFGFDIEKLEKVLYAFSLPVQRHNKKKRKTNVCHSSKSKFTESDYNKNETQSLVCEVTVKHLNMSSWMYDEEDIISVGGRLNTKNIKYISLLLDINCAFWDTKKDVHLEVRLLTSNNNRSVWNRFINLYPGRNEGHTACFGNGSGDYFGIGISTFYINIGGKLVSTYNINVEEGRGFLNLW